MRKNGFQKELPALPPLEVFHVYIINPLTPRAFCQRRMFCTFWRSLMIFMLDMSQTSFNQLKKAFVT